MRSLKFIGFLGIGLACCLVFAQEPSRKLAAADAKTFDGSEQVYTKVYPIEDLPVWSKDGTYNPKLLVALIEMTIAPKTWEALGGPSKMALYPKNASLVVSTNSANHDALVAVLIQLRR